MKISFLFLSLIINLIALFIISYRNLIAFKVLDIKLKIKDLFLINNFIFLIGYLTPFRYTSAVSAPILYKYKYNVPTDKTCAVFFLDILLYLLIQVLVVSLFFKFIPNLTDKNYIKLIIALSIFLVFILMIFKVRNRFLSIANDILNNLKKLISTKEFLIKYLVAAVIFVFLIPLMVYFIFLSLSINTTYLIAFIAYWLSLTIGFISGIPGGFGARDLTMGSILVLLLNIDVKISALAVLLYRIISMLPHFIFGGFYFLLIGKEIKDLIKNKSKNKLNKADSPEEL